MKIRAINVLQLALAIAIVGSPQIGANYPASTMWMHIVAATASAILGTINFYAPSPIPSKIVGPQGVQVLHVLQGLASTIVSILASAAAAQPHNLSLSHAAHLITTIGGVLTAAGGIFSPQALPNPIQAMRTRALLRNSRPKPPPPAPLAPRPPSPPSSSGETKP